MRLILFVVALLLWSPLPGRAAPTIDAALAAYGRGDLASARHAFAWLARQGVAAAQYNLAVMHLRAELPGASARQAVRLMTQAADGGFVTAMVGLAQLYEAGRPGVAADPARAQRWYLSAAEAGSVDAQVAVGTAHYLGRGAVQDAKQAARWYRVAAQAGDVGAQYLIAAMYEHGDGVERDLREARYWYGAAARNGDEAAPSKLRELDAKLADPVR